MPGSVVTIDETMISWRDRLLFKQYVPDKAHNYSVKMYKLAATQGRREELRAGGGYFQKWEKGVVQSNSAWE
jgi:hypothetical protein